MAIIRAIDVGFGNTKYTLGRHGEVVTCRMFPSLVPEPAETTAGADVLTGRRKTVKVTVGNSTYEVGPDVERVIGTRDGRSLHRDFAMTDEYLALAHGAMTYMGQEHIDLLVVGLPVNASRERYQAVEERMRGEHVMGNGRLVNVKRVAAVAQPMGGFIDYAAKNNLMREIQQETSLLIDVGFFTLDWVVARGPETMAGRSGGYDAGVSEILKRINTAIKKDLKCDDISINRLDHGLRDGSIRLFGEAYEMSRWLGAGDAAINEGMNALQAKVGASDDIDNIFVCGGGGDFYVEEIRKRFPRHAVKMVDDPVFANVRGFQLLGEIKWKGIASAQAAS